MARIVAQYPLEDLGMRRRAIEERRGHGNESPEGNGRSRAVPKPHYLKPSLPILKFARTWVAHKTEFINPALCVNQRRCHNRQF
jgi:hypothetical protein